MGYLEYVLLFKLFIYVFETYLDLRQYRRFKQSERPENIRAIVSEDDFSKSQAY